MIILITGASHTGKSFFAQKLLEKYAFPILSLDLLKMGLIRSGQTDLTVYNDDALTNYLWPIVRAIIQTALENEQNLIIEGCYIPFHWKKDFNENDLKKIKYLCLVMSSQYICNRFDDIKRFANVVERRLNDADCCLNNVLKENENALYLCQKYELPYFLIEKEYVLPIDF